MLALLGPSGSGKTTTLRLLAGFEVPDEGRVLVEGEDVTGVAPVSRRFGMVFQHYALFPHLDVRANVAFGLESIGVGGAELDRRVGRALALVDLAGFGARRIGQLSGGQQQRVALARALAPEPRVLLLDEPLSNLDPTLRERTRREIRDLIHRLGITTVLVTHEQDEAFELGDRVAVLQGGRLEQVGTPDELYGAPANRFVGGFVGRSSTAQVEVLGPSARGVRISLEGAEWDVERTPGRPLPPVGPALMLVRPEALRLTPREPGAAPATIVARRFVGPSAAVHGAHRRRCAARGRRAAAGRAGRRAGRAHAEPARGRRYPPLPGATRGEPLASRPARSRPRCSPGWSWLVVYPLVLVLLEGLRGPVGWTLRYVRLFFERPTEWRALWGSLWISLASVVLAAAIGIPARRSSSRATTSPAGGSSARWWRCPPSCRRSWGCSPSSSSTARRGFVSLLVQRILRLDDPPWRLEGAGAILLVHAYSMYVYFYLFARAALQSLDASLYEAAASLGARRWRTLRRVVLPQLYPALGGAALLTFMTALASFSAPYIFGGGFRVMTTQIVATRLNGDDELAMVETISLTLAGAGGALALSRRAGPRRAGRRARRARRPPGSPFGAGRSRLGLAVLGWRLAGRAAAAAPDAAAGLVRAGRDLDGRSRFRPAYTLRNYVTLVQDPVRARPLVNSLWLATVATIAAVVDRAGRRGS